MAGPHLAPLLQLQPSQLFVSSVKLAAVLGAWPDRDAATLKPVPVKRYGHRLVLTDGHTRALAAHRAGLRAVPVVQDEDDLDDEAYETCVGWCLAECIRSAVDLDDRVIGPQAYQRFWLDRCRELHDALAAR